MGRWKEGRRAGFSAAADVLSLLLAGCTEKTDAPHTEDLKSDKESARTVQLKEEVGKTEDTLIPAVAIAKVQSVLNIELNGPNPRYQAVMHEIMTSPGSEKEKQADYDSLIESLYGPYFTEDGLYRLKATGVFRYHLIEETNYSLRLIEAEVTQSDVKTASNQYNITAVVEMAVDGMEPGRFDMVGKAVFNKKEGKIGDFYIEDPSMEIHDKLFQAVNGADDPAD
ncbi:hypothetical protein [Sporosarcina koreensis]|uniref:hypothetical protein n=1 Tax=Sporosarcina koreensis TaxID=334735 RepID=UPI00058F652D|nr:hypothetical protein [Sporosarcina koreensis]